MFFKEPIHVSALIFIVFGIVSAVLALFKIQFFVGILTPWTIKDQFWVGIGCLCIGFLILWLSHLIDKMLD